MELPNKRSSLQVDKAASYLSFSAIMLCVICLLASLLLWWSTWVSNFSVNKIQVTESQTIEDLQKPIEDCEYNRQEDFTCILVPLMVSKEYAKQHVEENR